MLQWFKRKKTKYEKLWKSLKLVAKIKKWYKVFEIYAGLKEDENFGGAYDKIKSVINGDEKLQMSHKTAYALAYIINNVDSVTELEEIVRKHKEG